MDWKEIVDFNMQHHPKYNKEFDQAAIEILSSEPFQSKAHLCKAFKVSKPTIIDWMKKHSSFRKSVELGLSLGEAKTRTLMGFYAFQPSKLVNNGLLILLAKNIYGINEEHKITVEDNNFKNVEQFLKDRNVPLPDIGVDDIGSPEDIENDIEQSLIDDMDVELKKRGGQKPPIEIGVPLKW